MGKSSQVWYRRRERQRTVFRVSSDVEVNRFSTLDNLTDDVHDRSVAVRKSPRMWRGVVDGKERSEEVAEKAGEDAGDGEIPHEEAATLAGDHRENAGGHRQQKHAQFLAQICTHHSRNIYWHCPLLAPRVGSAGFV